MKSKIRFISLIILIVPALFGCSKPGDSIVSRAMNAYSVKDYDRALELFNEALESDTRYSQAVLYSFIANVYMHQEETKLAAEYQAKAMESQPDYRGYVMLGMLYHSCGEDTAAEEAYKKAIAMNAEKGEAYASLGALYLVQEHADRAVELLEKASALEPKLAVIKANLGVAYAMLGNEKASTEALEQAEALKCENIGQFRERAKQALVGTN
ncbi:MAG: tetratricopeptide repeat protein [Treponema sp.]|nr:tetratricopeptide repeat protein [Treponema sp.]